VLWDRALHDTPVSGVLPVGSTAAVARMLEHGGATDIPVSIGDVAKSGCYAIMGGM